MRAAPGGPGLAGITGTGLPEWDGREENAREENAREENEPEERTGEKEKTWK